MSDEILDIEEEKLFAEALELKRHKEQMSALKGIATLLSKPEKDDNKAIVDAIKKQGESLDKVAAAISNQPKPEKPEVNVTIENKEILSLLREVKDGNDKMLKALESKPMVESFDFQYDNWGGIKTAKVNYKNQITKPKYQA